MLATYDSNLTNVKRLSALMFVSYLLVVLVLHALL